MQLPPYEGSNHSIYDQTNSDQPIHSYKQITENTLKLEKNILNPNELNEIQITVQQPLKIHVGCPTSFYVALTAFTVLGFAIDYFGLTDMFGSN